jgi:hypothetical protein
MTKITAETTIPIQNSKKAKDATLILDGDQVQIKTPAMFSLPAVKLDDLTAAVEELQAIAAVNAPGLPAGAGRERLGDETEDVGIG